MALHAKTDFLCTLTDKSGKELLKFKATASSELVISADFVGGGIASGGQAFTISTEREFAYQPFAHYVSMLGMQFVLQTVTVSFRKPLGAGGRLKKVYIMELQ